MGSYRSKPPMPGESYREFQNRETCDFGCGMPQYMVNAAQPFDFCEPANTGQGSSNDSYSFRHPEEKMTTMQTEYAMEKDWTEYVEKTRAQSRIASAQYNELSTGGYMGEDPLTRMGLNMTEMNGPELAPLKVGSLPSLKVGSLPSIEEAHRKAMNEMLADRQKTHGCYAVHTMVTQGLKDELHHYGYRTKLRSSQRETLDMIMHKIGRILAGDPDFVDHWKDIAGYATLEADLCEKTKP